MSNILEVTFESGQTFATATRLWKGDYGQILLIHGPELPSYYEVHFASTKDGTPEVSVGTPSGVQIPNRLLQAEGYIYAWVFLHVGANDGYTKFQVKIPVEERGIPIDQETPADQTAVQQAIAALNAETGRAEAAADAAEVSEQNAKASEDAAALSEQNAEDAAQAAAVSAENAAISETGAAESEAAAAASAQQAATSAEAAAQYAASAGGSEELVEEYARRAKGSADTAELYGTMAVNAKDAAEASARSATQASQAAVSAKNIAETAAQTATQKASEASSSAGVASSQASMAAAEAAAASGYADNAEGSARQAATSAEDAANSADDADDSAASARLHDEQAQAAKVDAQTAAGNASAAQTAAEAAQTAAETAQGKAEDAQDAAEAAQSSAEEAQTAAETAQGLAEAAQAAAENAAETLSGSIDQIAQNTDDIEDLQAEVINMYPVDTADGPVASFPDGADDIPLKSLIVDINPVQDLHGYDSPWPAGGGKNILPITVESQTYNGLKIDVITDGAGNKTGIRIHGTAASVVTELELGSVVLGAGTYKVNGCNSGTSDFRLQLKRGDISSTSITQIYNGGYYSFTVTESDTYLVTFVAIGNGATWDITVYPQIFASSITDNSFAPYSNECPISGWDKVEMGQSNANILNIVTPLWTAMVATDLTWESKIENGAVVSGGRAGYRQGTSISIPIKAGKYTVSGILSGEKPSNFEVYQVTLNNDGTWATRNRVVYIPSAQITLDEPFNRSFTVTDEYTHIAIQFFSATKYGCSFKNPMVNVGETALTFVPYSPNSRDIIIQLGDTYYGAQLDVLTGDGIATWISVSKPWSEWVAQGGDYGDFNLRAIYVSDAAVGYGGQMFGKALSNETNYQEFSTNPKLHFYFATNQLIRYFLPKTFEESKNVQVAYELDEPIPFHVDPQEINSFLGTNNIWADTGDTHTIYRADIGLYIQKLTGSKEDDMIANNAIASGKYFLVGNRLFLSTAAIAAGATLTPGTNCVETNLAAALNAINS